MVSLWASALNGSSIVPKLAVGPALKNAGTLNLNTDALKEKKHEFGNHTVDRSDLDVVWRHPKLAAQQELGLWTQRRTGIAGHRPDCSVVDGATLTLD
jgi:hypothetical protein